MKVLGKLKRCKITYKEFKKYDGKIFSVKPFEREGSFMFFKAVKYGNYEAVKEILAT